MRNRPGRPRPAERPGEEAEPRRPAAGGARRNLERAAALAVAAGAVAYLVRFLIGLRHTSLWNDELYSAVRTSGRGPWFTVTTYTSANNHIFFNLLNALTPDAGSVDPLRARLWAIVPTLALLVLLGRELARRGWYLGAAVLVALFATNQAWLDLHTQGRGYGLLALAAGAGSVAVWRWFEAETSGALAVLAVATWLGTWTVPTFVLFAGPLWLVVLAVSRRRAVLGWGAAALVAIAVVYAPVLDGVRHEMATYGEQWGRTFHGPRTVAAVLRLWLFSPEIVPGRLVSAGAALGGTFEVIPALAALAPVAPALRRTVWALVGSTAAFFAVVMAMGTALPRTTAFTVVPVGLCGVAVGASLLEALGERADRGRTVVRSVPATWAQGAVVVAVAGLLVGHAAVGQAGLEIVPLEDRRGESAYVDETYGTGVDLAMTRSLVPDIQSAYLADGRRLVDAGRHRAALAAGRAALYDDGVTERPDFPVSTFTSVAAEVRFRQLRGDYVRIVSAPPLDAGVAGLRVDGAEQALGPLVDRRPTTGPRLDVRRGPVTVTVTGTPAGARRSLILVLDGPAPPVAGLRVRWGPSAGDPRSRPAVVSGSTVVVPLGDRDVATVEVTFAAEPGRASVPALREVWFNPT